MKAYDSWVSIPNLGIQFSVVLWLYMEKSLKYWFDFFQKFNYLLTFRKELINNGKCVGLSTKFISIIISLIKKEIRLNKIILVQITVSTKIYSSLRSDSMICMFKISIQIHSKWFQSAFDLTRTFFDFSEC